MLIRTDATTIYNTETGRIIKQSHSGRVVLDGYENDGEIRDEEARNLWAKLCMVADTQLDMMHMGKMKLQQKLFHNKENQSDKE